MLNIKKLPCRRILGHRHGADKYMEQHMLEGTHISWTIFGEKKPVNILTKVAALFCEEEEKVNILSKVGAAPQRLDPNWFRQPPTILEKPCLSSFNKHFGKLLTS